MIAVCLLTAGAVPGTAQAQNDFNRYFNAAVQLYNSGESERALEQLQNAKKRTSKLQQDISVALYEGLILADLGQKEQALAAFETAILLDPNATFPTKVSPKLNDEFEEVRKRVQKKLAQGTEQQSPPFTEQPRRPPATSNLNPPATPAPKSYEPQPSIAKQSRARIPVTPLVFAAAGVASAGVGVVFGMQSRSNIAEVRDAYEGRLPSATEVRALGVRLEDARGQARMANMLFGTAALAVSGAVVSWLLASDDSGPESKEER